uniref:Uncharacterized protein n=1 Tax=Angiostrongylus cantonensis TaxID=6313 RepID=A0A0K0D088_ANGCA
MIPNKPKTIIGILILTILYTVVESKNETEGTNTASLNFNTLFPENNLAEIVKRNDELGNQLSKLISRVKYVEEHINDTNNQIATPSMAFANQSWLQSLIKAATNNQVSTLSLDFPNQPWLQELIRAATINQQVGTPSMDFPNQPWLQALVKAAMRNQQKPQDIIEYPVIIVPDASLCPIAQPHTRPHPVYPRIENQVRCKDSDYNV